MAAKAIRALRAFRGHAKNLAQTAKSGNIKITKSLAKIAREFLDSTLAHSKNQTPSACTESVL
jgi:hypothetical protein